MKTKFTKLLSLTLALILALSCITIFASCKNKTNGGDTQNDAPETVRVMTLNGTTGFGIAKLWGDNKANTTAQKYDISIETDGTVVRDALINGSVDIAALPTNLAAMTFNKTNGGVKVIALNTGGVLYIANSNETKITSLDDFKEGGAMHGATVYSPAQNPAFIFKYVCQKAGLKVGEDIKIDTKYAEPAALSAALADGSVKLAVIPEPLLTATKAKANKAGITLTTDLDVTKEWNKIAPEGSLIQGCVVVRTEFANKYPEAVKKFLEEYKASIEFVIANPAEAGTLIEQAGIFANGTVAANAIPRCNLCYIDGADMKSALSVSIQALFEVAPQSIGEKLPTDDFYYVAK